MAEQQVSSTSCEVDIVTPEGVTMTFTPKDAAQDLLHIHTHNDMAEACGTFTLTFAPRRINGRTYDQLIPMRSLVTIRMQDPSTPVDNDTAVVMLGLTEDHGFQGDYTRSQPQEVVSISGRSPAALLLDAKLFYHPGFEEHPEAGVLRSAEAGATGHRLFWDSQLVGSDIDPRHAIGRILTYFLGLPGRTSETSLKDALTQQTDVATLRKSNPQLTPAQAEAFVAEMKKQQEALARQGDGTGHQLLNLELPGLTVADLLEYDERRATLFEEGITVPIGQNTAFAGSLWNYLHVFVDPLFQELFSRMEGGRCRLLFRAKPFLQTYSGTGTRFRDDDPTLVTREMDQGIVLTMQLRRQSSPVYNFFRILPIGASASLQEPSFLYRIAPTVITDLQQSSAVQRYGLRVLDHLSPYLSALPTIPSTPHNATDDSVVAAAQRWGKIGSVFYGSGAEFYAGMFRVLGSPNWNIGVRFVTKDERGELEGYTEGCDHSYDFRTGMYTTDLRVTRLWYLSGPTDSRERASSAA